MSECTHNCSSCSAKCSTKSKQDFLEPINAKSKIKHVIGIVSGKGGVGKSMVTSSLAVLLNKMGYKVGILDADITGPSIPKSFGINSKVYQNELGILPAETKNGIKIMSINLLLEDKEAPVLWRGPVIAGAVKQFWHDVVWGDLDYLFVDCPPGTGDVPLTVFQSIKIDGIIVITTPQDLVSMIVKKAINMANMMNIPVLGIIENMSYFICPDCNKKTYLFGESKTQKVADEYGLKVLANIPLNPNNISLIEEGKITEINITPFESAINYIKELK
jgi:Mrp family chromosome partitioning ATPase